METPGAVARASMRAISADCLLWALVVEALRCGGARWSDGGRDGEEALECRFVAVFSSIVVDFEKMLHS